MSNVAVSLISDKEIRKVFSAPEKLRDEHIQKYKDFKLEKLTDIRIAKENELIMNEFLKVVEEIKKKFKAPYWDAGKAIDEAYNQIVNPVNELLSKMKEERLKFQQENEGKIKERIAELESLIETSGKDHQFNRTYVERICKTMQAKLIGGNFYNRDGELKLATECNTVAMTAELQVVVEKSLKFDQAGVYEPYLRTYFDIWKSCANVWSDAITDNNEQSKEFVFNRLDEATITLTRQIEDHFVKMYQNELSVLIIQEKKVTAGRRKTISYEVIDIRAVPIEYLTIDEEKVKEFIKANKDGLKDGTVPMIAGLKLSYNESAVIG